MISAQASSRTAANDIKFCSPLAAGMYINSRTALSARDVLLVPYCRHHVQTYHEWMQDADLRQATASEELTIEEEYSMQQAWRKDHDKLTFIICKPLAGDVASTKVLQAGEIDAAGRMVGDINLFLYEVEEDDLQRPIVIGEIELMIAQMQSRRQGFGRAALLAFLMYITAREVDILEEHCAGTGSASTNRPSRLAYLRVKINESNKASISLFENVGFQLLSPMPNYFGELELRLQADTELLTSTSYSYTSIKYQDEA